MLTKLLLNFYFNLIFILNFFLIGGLDVDNVDVINLLKNTQDPYKVFHLKKNEKFTREDLENNYETVKQLIEATENEEDKDEALKKLDEFKEKLVEKAVEKEGPGDTEPEEEEVAENHEGPEQPSGEATENKEKKKKPGKAEKKEKAGKNEKTKKDTKEKTSKGKISKEKAKENEGINSHSNSEDSSASSEGQFEDGPDIVKRPPVGSEELPSEKTVHWPEVEEDEKRRRERKEEKERRERNREEEENKRSRQEKNKEKPEEISDESGPKLVEESESSESPEDEYERRSKEREQLTHGYTSTFCKKYIHRCYIEEYMTEMTTHCKDICDLLGTLNIDIGLNCEELALSGLCSDGMWGDKMDKYCHRSCTSLRGKR
uniref:ShKT domain-containing protein n=1 Tax=Meloidogyne javanica TaxID=6303 RepID=A0A915LED9_MELJA